MNQIDLSWCAASVTIALSKDEVHVWRASLYLADSQREDLLSYLSPAELNRAENLNFQKTEMTTLHLTVFLGRY